MSRYAYNKTTKESTLISGSQSAVVIAGAETTSTSSQAYTVGQYLVYGNLLYKVISAIAQGDTLVPGTNISATTVAGEISNHLAVDGTEFYFDTHDGKFGYNTSPSRGADTFVPFKSSDSSDISAQFYRSPSPYNNTIDFATYGMVDVLYAAYVQSWSGMYSAVIDFSTNTYLINMGYCAITKISNTQIQFRNTDSSSPNRVSALVIGVDSLGNTVIVGLYP